MPLIDLSQIADPRLLKALRREPVLVRTFVGTVVTLLVQLGLPIDQGLANTITAAAIALLAVSARSKVAPA